MTASASTVAWIGAGGVVIGAAVGALSGWASAAITSSRARRDARTDRRRDAYAAYIEALDDFLRLILGPGVTDDSLADPAWARALSQALAVVEHCWVGVLLVGSREARAEVEEMREARWALSELLRKPENPMTLLTLAQTFSEMSDDFTELARRELA